ncbi:hypothetical protein OJF2_26270 [Aquisphaera giovannonii]|uniref:DUF2961 domain-containing protein n=1 Tax=Aquisphaera giovannonii TaxID=406548 RepID=A0A5B9W0M5_9BACT|nr:glycoside hydrolase family 172 protein [Aquisphaera giovannonii]QEH34093.1 hypothetical protein OJF2_26270 [Aquisphaera giovannonii]
MHPAPALLMILATAALPPGLADPAAPAARGFLPAGTPAELRDVGLLARLRDPGVRPVGFSSYDRTGGNNDGFNGTYSKLRVEQGNSVLAELSGPGIIQRIWFTHTVGERPGLLDRKREHIRIYLDGKAHPALDIPVEELFSGDHSLFPHPLVVRGSGGFVSYVPIPFRSGCKVVVDGQGVRFYQIGILQLPREGSVASFTDAPDTPLREELRRTAAVWSDPEKGMPDRATGLLDAKYEVEGLGGSTHRYVLPPGPATIRSLEVTPAPGTEEAWKAARLRMAWEADDDSAPAVDVPLGAAFGIAYGSAPYRSILIGQKDGTWYDRYPMPYRRQAILRIDTEKPLKGTIVARYVKQVAADDGYFRASWREATPARKGEDFPWLKQEGRGHFAGVFLMTEGTSKLPYWLEGDDRFRVDGTLAVHGTGSEDYFNCGWYALEGRLDRPGTYPVHGFSVYQNQGERWQVAAYRWHLPDPVPFSRSIEAGIEHGGQNDVAADYRAVVFWYSERPKP